jgi:hypothetical protein
MYTGPGRGRIDGLARGGWGGTTTGAGTQDNAVLVAANVIYKF